MLLAFCKIVHFKECLGKIKNTFFLKMKMKNALRKDEECQRSKVAFHKMPRQNKFGTFFLSNNDLPQLRGNLYNNKWTSLKHYLYDFVLWHTTFFKNTLFTLLSKSRSYCYYNINSSLTLLILLLVRLLVCLLFGFLRLCGLKTKKYRVIFIKS